MIYGCTLDVNLYGWHLGERWSAASGSVGVRCHYYGDGVRLHLSATGRRELGELISATVARYALPDPLELPARSWSQPRLLELD